MTSYKDQQQFSMTQESSMSVTQVSFRPKDSISSDISLLSDATQSSSRASDVKQISSLKTINESVTPSSSESPTDISTTYGKFSVANLCRFPEKNLLTMDHQSSPHRKGKKKKKLLKELFTEIGFSCCGLFRFCYLICPPIPCCFIPKVAFRAPDRSYYFVEINGTKKIYSSSPKLNPQVLYHIEYEYDNDVQPNKQTTDSMFVITKCNKWIACVFIRPVKQLLPWTILYSHPNGTDLGDHLFRFPGLQNIADSLGVNICIYDYVGYGISNGKPNEKYTYDAIRAVHEMLQSRYQVTDERLVLWGYSLGTAVSINLASQLPHLQGLILSAPFMSALRIVCEREDYKQSCKCDQFKSIDIISRIQARTLVLHGTEDLIVPFSHGITLFSKCKHPVEPLFLPGAGHDIELYEQFWTRIFAFLNELSASKICIIFITI